MTDDETTRKTPAFSCRYCARCTQAVCGERWNHTKHAYLCTRPRGHSGHHAACDIAADNDGSGHLLASWYRPDDVPVSSLYPIDLDEPGMRSGERSAIEVGTRMHEAIERDLSPRDVKRMLAELRRAKRENGAPVMVRMPRSVFIAWLAVAVIAGSVLRTTVAVLWGA